MREYEATLLENGFFRVHRSHMINLAWVDGYEKSEGGKVILKGGDIVPISHRQKDKFFKKMDSYFS